MATPKALSDLLVTDLRQDTDLRTRLVEETLNTPPPVLLSVEDLESQEPPVWYLEQFIQEDSLTVLYGPPKVGKTYLALEWAHSLALGKPWIDFNSVPIRVLYCSAEGNRTLGERTKALRQARTFSPPEALKFLPGSRNLFFKGDRPEAGLELIRALDEFQPHVVFIDTLARHTPGGDIAANVDVSRVIATVDELREGFGCSFVFVHHTRKDKKDFLGAQALFGAADGMVEVDPNEHGAFDLHTRSKDLEDYTPPWSFKVVSVSDQPGWAVIDHGEQHQAGPQQGAVLEVLKERGPMTATQLQTAVWGEPGKQIYNVLRRLEEKGAVTKKQVGKVQQWIVVDPSSPF